MVQFHKKVVANKETREKELNCIKKLWHIEMD